MNHMVGWMTPELMQPLGLALLHFFWQGTLVAALAGVAMALTRKAAVRYAIAVTCLALMAAAPVATFLWRTSQPIQPVWTVTQDGAARMSSDWAALNPPSPSREPASGASQTRYLWLVQAWFLGVLLLSLRTAGGILLVERLRRKHVAPAADWLLARCHALQGRIGLHRAIRYCESLHVDAPAVVGWFRPMVLLPISAITGLSEGQLDAVIAHELAHIRRYDAFVNLFQMAVETLLFYHPAVWWLNKCIREERENCCDDIAVEVCGSRLEYARALTMMEEWRMTPALALGANQGSLTARVRRVLGAPGVGNGLRTAGVSAVLLCLCVAAAAAQAFLGSTPHLAKPASWPQTIVATIQGPAAKQSLADAKLVSLPAAELASGVVATPPTAQSPNTQTSSATGGSAQSATNESYIDSLKSAGLDHLTVDELIGLKLQGVTADYVRQMSAAGLKPSVDALIGMKVQGITPDYLKQMQAQGVRIDVDSLIGMKVQGITPEYVAQMKDLHLNVDTDSLIGMKVQGITPEYVKELESLGLNVDADSLIGMKVQGITPEYVKEMRSLGLAGSADGLIGMKIQGISPEYVREMRATGLALNSDNLVGMKVQGITPDYVKSLQAAGFKVDADDCIGAKVAGVTPELIEKVRKHGFQNLDLEKLIELKQMGVLEK